MPLKNFKNRTIVTLQSVFLTIRGIAETRIIV